MDSRSIQLNPSQHKSFLYVLAALLLCCSIAVFVATRLAMGGELNNLMSYVGGWCAIMTVYFTGSIVKEVDRRTTEREAVWLFQFLIPGGPQREVQVARVVRELATYPARYAGLWQHLFSDQIAFLETACRSEIARILTEMKTRDIHAHVLRNSADDLDRLNELRTILAEKFVARKPQVSTSPEAGGAGEGH